MILKGVKHIGRKIIVLVSLVFLLFVHSNINVFASEIIYNSPNGVFYNVDNSNPVIDDNLSTGKQYQQLLGFNLDFAERPITGLYFKSSGFNEFDYIIRGKSGALSPVIKTFYTAGTGATYYLFEEPVMANRIEFKCKVFRSTMYEVELFSVPMIDSFDINIDQFTIDSIDISYATDLATSYDIYIDDVLQTSTSDKNYSFTDLIPSTDYSIKVVANADGYISYTAEKVVRTDSLDLILEKCNRIDRLDVNDSIAYIFNKDISTFTSNSITNFDSYAIDGKTLTINLTNDYETVVNMDFIATDFDGKTLTIKQEFKTIKKGGILMDFTFVTDWMTSMVGDLTSSAKVVLIAGLGLLGLIVGGFFLIGLAKKAVKKSK